MGINRDDWLAAVAAVEPTIDPEALSRAELGALLGLKRSTMQERLKKLVATGAATRTYKQVTDIFGRRQTVVAYRLVGVPHENRTGRGRR